MQNKKLKIAVIFGGRSGEHEVSLASASSVIKNLNKKRYEIVQIGISKKGRWILGPNSIDTLKKGKEPRQSNIIVSPEPPGNINNIFNKIDIIFPVIHGPFGEDGTLQGLLEFTNIPYVGCGHLSSSICMDKVMQKKVLEAYNFKQTKYIWFRLYFWLKNKKEIIKNLSLKYPLFVKPANLGSSVGITKVTKNKQLESAIEFAFQYDRKIIIEEGIKNAREIEIGVLGNQNPKISMPGEIISSNDFYDYDAKYIDNKSKFKIPADLSQKKIKKIKKISENAFKALDCEGMARIDFLLSSSKEIFINELNTIPGFTLISMYPKLWEASGIGYQKLLDNLISLAIQRNNIKQNLKTSYTPKQEWYNK